MQDTGCKRYWRPFFWSLQKLLQKILREWQRNETLHICSFFHKNLTFWKLNNPQQRRPPPASTWTSCRPSWSPPWGGSSTPPRWRWQGAASCCGGPVNISLRNATQKNILLITIKWTRRPDLWKNNYLMDCSVSSLIGSWTIFKSYILWALLRPQCSSVVLSFDIKLFVMFLLHENWSTPWQNPSQCCRRCCWSQPSPCWSSRRRSLWQGLLHDLPVASCLLLMTKNTAIA